MILIKQKRWMFIDAKSIKSMTIDTTSPMLIISTSSGKKIYIDDRCHRLLSFFTRQRHRIVVNWLGSSILQLNYFINKREVNKYEKK